MNETQQDSPSAGLDLGAIYYTLFRHKWKIIVCSLLGFAGAVYLFETRPPPYQSESELLISYVVQDGGASPGIATDDSMMKSPDVRGETIINSEIQILRSEDLARQVATIVGPARIVDLADLPPESQANASAFAAAVIRDNLSVSGSGSIIRIIFSHQDPAIVQPVLQALITSYIAKSNAVHGPNLQADDATEQIAFRLEQELEATERELSQLRNDLGIVSLDDFKATSSAEIARLRILIRDAKADLAQRESRLKLYEARNFSPESPNELPATIDAPTAEQQGRHAQLVATLDQLRQREASLLAQGFNPQSTLVTSTSQQRQELEEEKRKLELDHPSLATSTGNQAATGSGNPYDPVAEADSINALKARLAFLEAELKSEDERVAQIAAKEDRLVQLERNRLDQASNFAEITAQLKQSQLARAFGSNQVSKIATIESPTIPLRNWGSELKLLAGVGFGGIVMGLGWAFAIELYLDRSLRRPTDVERSLKLPLFISLPKIDRKEAHALAKVPTPGDDSDTQVLNPFFETLRDRMFRMFEGLNILHKPKLVAVTGVGRGTGVTSVAAGLARSISNTKEGNVLLVDMTKGQGIVQQFQKGRAVSLDQLFESRQTALVGENLYVVGGSSDTTLATNSTRHGFHNLVPKLKSSDFDYIIFDMPPVNQISITPRLASFMDFVLMVTESERTDRDIARRAATLLGQSSTTVGVVLNKNKTYVPPRLHQDREFLLGE